MYSTTDRVPKFMKVAVALTFTAALAASPLALAAEPETADAGTQEVTGEIVDMMCYVDHNAMGEKHASCGEKCIKGGAPVGIVSDGKALSRGRRAQADERRARPARRQDRHLERQDGEQRRRLDVGERRDRQEIVR